MKYLREIYVGEIETDDSLNYLNMEKILNLTDDDEYPEIISTNDTDSNWDGECVPMEINELVRIVGALKEKGATHVEIMFHEDHGNYVFNGVELHEANDIEIDLHKLEQKNMTINEKQKKIAELEKKLAELKNQ